jgi:hypothetical protein
MSHQVSLVVVRFRKQKSIYGTLSAGPSLRVEVASRNFRGADARLNTFYSGVTSM